MKEIIQRFCGNENNKPNYNNGLLLIDMPTGIGKTNAVFDFIVENYEEIAEQKRKIFFLTTLKKNLQLDKLKKKFAEKYGKTNGESKFNRNVLFIDSNWEAVYSVLSKDDNRKIEFALKNIINKELIDKIMNAVNTIKEFENYSKKDNSMPDVETEGDIGYESFAFTAKDELRSQLEPALRKELERAIGYNENGQIRTASEKKKLANSNFSFIKELYPASRTDDCPILFMSLDKFLARNCPIIQNSYQFMHNKMIEGSVVFIDEFDACKDTILNNIIEQSLKSRLNLIQMFRVIYDGLHHSDFTERLCETSQTSQKKKDERNERWRIPREIIENLAKISKAIYDDFTFKYIFKKELDSKEINFIFHDIKYHHILPSNTAEASVEPTKDELINLIKFLKFDKDKIIKSNSVEAKEGEPYHLNVLLNRLRNFIVYFQTGINYLANNYLEKKREADSIVDYTKEWAVKTVLSEFHIEGIYNKYLVDNIMLNARQQFSISSRKNNNVNNNESIHKAIVDINPSVYERGFQYYDFVDSEEHDTSTKINYLAFYDSPEKFILSLASLAKVVGVSATATLPTVTGNFDIKYLKKRLLNDFIEPTNVEQLRLNDLFESRIGGYDEVDILPESINAGDSNDVDEDADIWFLEQAFGNREIAIDIYGKLTALTNDSFEIKRYLRIITTMSKFISNNNIKSILCLMNKKADSFPALNYPFLRDTFNVLRDHRQVNNCCLMTLWGDANKFEKKKDIIHKVLAEGKKVFVLSTYQTLGAGQNLQYAVSEEMLDDLIQINDSDYEDTYKDFDALYLDKPTNVFIRLNNDKTGADLAKFLYYVGFLRQNGEMDLDETDRYIKLGFKNSRYIPTPDKNSINIHYARIILQAVGRICRTKNKNGKIYIYFDEELKAILSKVHCFFERRRLNPEFKALLNYCGKADTCLDEEEKLKNEAINNSTAIHREIMGMLKSDWNYSSQNRWRRYRELVLKFPCIDKLTNETPSMMYIELPIARKGYYYKQEHDFSDTEISFSKSIDGGTYVSEEKCGLDRLMNYLPLKQFFESQNYMTSFSKSKYFIPPVVFNNIYKGALGEVAGKFILENKILKQGDSLSEIDDLEKFEKFDFEFNDIFIDFKNWSWDFFVDATNKISDVRNRLESCRGKKALYINVLQLKDGQQYNPTWLLNGKILVVPQLIKLDNRVDEGAITAIRKFIYE